MNPNRISLSPNEARVIACLIEKEITTPDQYPLSLNALTLACNQKSNRDPVMNLTDRVVQETLDGLRKRHLVSEKTGYGSRVAKYQHRFCNTEFSNWKFSPQELGILCELLLRGPQTPGELRAHTERLCRFTDMDELEATLTRLMEHRDGPLAVRLPREPGKRESRYAQTLCGEIPIASTQQPVARTSEGPAGGAEQQRLDELELELMALREELDRLKRRFEEFVAKS
jgi:hypothetical protein